ncbi:MAG: hypothetical protein IKQ49_00135 [Eubacterium sp.]|nr:hypothetical protein [Eubacterium sp.]
MTMTEGELQYAHSWLNQRYFDGRLQAAIIRFFPELAHNERGCEGVCVTTDTIPCIIELFINPEEYGSLVCKGHIITVLLHEMIHQYCSENDIDDTDHNEAFVAEAEKRGMTRRGYVMTEPALLEVYDVLNIYEKAFNVKLEAVPNREEKPINGDQT